ncbi:MAG: ATP-binding protein [Chitinophagaceae bacterium]
MATSVKKRLFIASAAYWILLAYIIAALVWWFIALEKQNRQMANYKIGEIKLDEPTYQTSYDRIMGERHRKTAQYIGEGCVILLLTLVGSVFVYQAVRKQIKLQQQQQNFMMAVTHELKTPIAVARLNLETILKHPLDEAKRQKLLQITLQETKRLDTLASNILVSSQLEGGKYHFLKEELDFSQLVKECVRDSTTRFPDRQWHSEVEEDIVIVGDPLLLQILVNNLLDNAVKYSPKQGTITCRMHQQQRHVLLEVSDEGPGIPDSEKNKVFDKFYRVGNEATRTAKGTGLGLYLCKKIAKDHHATIRATDNSPAGSTFIIRFTV